MASARLGCDMSHVICTPAAAAVIKTYSPNLMVHPLMREGSKPGSEGDETDPKAISKRVIEELLPRLHVLVVGPGLGRDPLMQQTVGHVVAAARKANIPLVLDADALLLVQNQPDLVKGYTLAVLTPNVVEFGRLEKAFLGDDKDKDNKDAGGKALRLSKALGGVTIVEKGAVDTVAAYTDDNAYGPYESDLTGGRKRSGGQGDTLTGSIATFLGWRKAYHDGLWDTKKPGKPLDERETVLLAAFAGSAITRVGPPSRRRQSCFYVLTSQESSRLAFVKRGRSLQASDLTEEVHTSFINLFGADEDEDAEAEGASKL